MVRAELEYMTKVPARLAGIETQLERIANALEQLTQKPDLVLENIRNSMANF